jgi:hypothetical protein
MFALPTFSLELDTSAETNIPGLFCIEAQQFSEGGGTAGWLARLIEALLNIETLKSG